MAPKQMYGLDRMATQRHAQFTYYAMLPLADFDILLIVRPLSADKLLEAHWTSWTKVKPKGPH